VIFARSDMKFATCKNLFVTLKEKLVSEIKILATNKKRRNLQTLTILLTTLGKPTCNDQIGNLP